MPRNTTTISAAPMARYLQQAGADRVSDEAARALVQVTTDISIKIATKAVALANHAGRKTVHAKDIILAAKP